jgi:hypothetical protein
LKREYILLFLTVVVSVFAGLGAIKWLAPQLLGLPADLQLVQVDEKRPAFFGGVFHSPDWNSNKIILQDPYTRVRARPFYPDIGGYGPNDLLGFRNSSVPNTADIVVIGDSQTYGNNANLQSAWPQQMRDQLAISGKDITVYTMATGGWGAVQYLEMMRYAPLFKPQMVIVAFYTGNDPMDTFITAYGMKSWSSLRLDSDLSAADAPSADTSLADEKTRWKVKFNDGTSTELNPELRQISNQAHPAIDAAYRIILHVAEQIARQAIEQGIKPVFTIIPTKEYVYKDKILRDGVDVIPEYDSLISSEQKRIEWLEKGLIEIEEAVYVDVISDLQHAALDSLALYPKNVNGHPLATGYAVLGKAVAMAISDEFKQNKVDDGLVGVMFAEASADKKVPVSVALKIGNTIRLFSSPDLALKHGWSLGRLRLISHRQYQHFQRLPDITPDTAHLYKVSQSQE